MEHYTGFILSSYGMTAAVVAILIIWVIWDGKLQARALAELEARGIRRRSEKPATPSDKGATDPSAN
ncbi:heme exporter protein CcmD [Cohaesibacter sp. ES.047]|uniref:heme exporter protein CcmD n=1 Tax=Cohaesibacter sp. ES.047 TaxID=1798205 RepID=UPI000BB68A93|nr:heme exporter protein CcmD [Cohaesibacter sp. ES.047]SNY90605.1 heme exporter protein CcmD [Cohaesibacter sp. ES.047]